MESSLQVRNMIALDYPYIVPAILLQLQNMHSHRLCSPFHTGVNQITPCHNMYRKDDRSHTWLQLWDEQSGVFLGVGAGVHYAKALLLWTPGGVLKICAAWQHPVSLAVLLDIKVQLTQ